MTLNEYQQRAMTTCLPESENFAYMMLNLAGEVGEIAGKVGKYIRKGYANIDGNHLHLYSQGDDNAAWERESDLRKEAGDVLWQLSGLCTVMGWDLEDIARQNLDKLADRQKRGVIASQGDNR
jgi:NTP pyrophosphatase (non-canonical NTP hydrolase)